MNVRVRHYVLAPLRSIRCDALDTLLGHAPGVYLCCAPEPDWHERFGVPRVSNPGLERKRQMFASMHEGSLWLSATQDGVHHAKTRTWTSPSGIVHVGNRGLRGRLGQLAQAFGMAATLWRTRRSYAYVLAYNFDLPQFFVAHAATRLLGKKLYAEYADDYTAHGGGLLKRFFEARLRRTVDAAVCIHEDMQVHFAPGVPTFVVNAFADLRYARDTQLCDGMTLLFSGRLDDVRGADLIPDLAASLRAKGLRCKIQVTGVGPLQSQVQGWELPEVEYLGFLEDTALARVTGDADACLVLQKPDHPFSRGSFPSKIELYARAKKPIFHLVRA